MNIAGSSWLIVGVFTAVIVLIVGAYCVRYIRQSRAALREHHRRMVLFEELYGEDDDESCADPEQSAENINVTRRERGIGNDETSTA